MVGGCWFRKKNKTKQEVHYSRCFWPVCMDVVVVCMNLLFFLVIVIVLMWMIRLKFHVWYLCMCVWIPLIIRIFCGLFIFKISISFKHHIIFNNNCACHCVCECVLFFLKKSRWWWWWWLSHHYHSLCLVFMTKFFAFCVMFVCMYVWKKNSIFNQLNLHTLDR